MTLQWVVLGITAFLALQRLPSAVRGENRGMFWAMFAVTLAVALSIPFFYLHLDSLLGGMNIANLLLRFCVFTAFLILGVKVTAAFNAPRAQRLISGPAGFFVLAVFVGVVTVFFVLSDLPESSTALRAYEDQSTVAAYGDTARLYQAYVAACLAPALFVCAVDSRRRADIRISAGLMSLGMSAVVIHTLLSLGVWNLPRGAWDRLLPYSAVLVISTALAMMWNARRIEKKKPKPNLLAEAYGTR